MNDIIYYIVLAYIALDIVFGAVFTLYGIFLGVTILTGRPTPLRAVGFSILIGTLHSLSGLALYLLAIRDGFYLNILLIAISGAFTLLLSYLRRNHLFKREPAS